MTRARRGFAPLLLTTLAALALAPAMMYGDDDKAKDAAAAPEPDKDGFYSLFDGKSLEGWKANEDPAVFKVEDGAIVVNGKRCHLFYDGPVQNHVFKDFHFKAEVKCFPNSNSGIYFHTEFQPDGWPAKGYESQVNNTYAPDPRKTGGLYAVKDVMNNSPAKDNEWFTYEIIVKGKDVTIKINGKPTTEFTEPEGWKPPEGMPGRKLGSGTFALQGHDPGSKVLFRNIMVKPLEK